MEKKQIDNLLGRIVRDKDEEAFKVLFNCYYPKLIQIALVFVPDILRAEEVVSDVFFKILKNPKTLKDIQNFDNYIFICVKNQSYTYLKKNNHTNVLNILNQKEDYILSDLINPENSLISEELFRIVATAVQQLPPKRKAVFQLVKEEGKKYREVAEILDLSVKTVELHMTLALKHLRIVVREYLDSKDIKVRKLRGSGFFTMLFSIFF